MCIYIFLFLIAVKTLVYNEDYFLADQERISILDVNKYSKKQLQERVKDFLLAHDSTRFYKLINGLKTTKYLASHKYPKLFEIAEDYYITFHEYLMRRRR